MIGEFDYDGGYDYHGNMAIMENIRNIKIWQSWKHDFHGEYDYQGYRIYEIKLSWGIWLSCKYDYHVKRTNMGNMTIVNIWLS